MGEVPLYTRNPKQPLIAWASHGRKEGRRKATWKREFKLPWREAGPPNRYDDEVDSDQ